MNTPRILVVDDEGDIRTLIQEILSEEGYEVTAASDAGEARAANDADDFDLVLLDIWMPEVDGITLLREWSDSDSLKCPVVMMSGHGTVDTAVEATRLGAIDFVEKPLSLSKLLRTVERALSEHRRRRPAAMRTLLAGELAPVGKSPVMQQLRQQARRLATHEAPVLITGEPGSGREAFARYMHSVGPRSDRPFVALAAAGLTEDQVETKLAGRADGDEPGYFGRAAGATLFVSGLEDLGERAQGLLLAALEERAYHPVGNGERPLDLRLITAAAADFEAHHPDFRQDLYSRLSVLTLRVPPLREYPEDVPELLKHYVDVLVDQEGLPYRRFGIAAQNRLRNYPWPGNVRELRNLVHRLLVLGGGEEITLEEIETELETAASADEPLVKQDLLSLPLREAREHFERAYLQQQLQLCNGKVGQLAKRVGMERTHLYRKLRSLGVDFRQSADD